MRKLLAIVLLAAMPALAQVPLDSFSATKEKPAGVRMTITEGICEGDCRMPVIYVFGGGQASQTLIAVHCNGDILVRGKPYKAGANDKLANAFREAGRKHCHDYLGSK